MYSSCATLKPLTHLSNTSKEGFRHGESGFWGEDIRGSLNNNTAWASRIGRSLSVEKNCRNIKPGVAYSVITKHRKKSVKPQPPVVERQRADPKNVAAIILGGGAGAQLFPLTSKTATPAVPIGGCYKLVDIPLSNCINSGISKIFVLTQFNSASLNRHISRTYTGNGVSFGDRSVEVLAATQTAGESGKQWFQGTADAVRQFLWLFEDVRMKHIDNILILSGDHLYRMDYMDFIQNHIDRNAELTLSCAPTIDSRASEFGLVKIDSRGRITQFCEKPQGDDKTAMQVDTSIIGLSREEAQESPYIASMGVYAFKTDVLLKLLKWSHPLSNDFGSEIIPAAIKEHNVQAYLFRDYWEDIGSIKSFYNANLALLNEFPKFEFYDPRTPFYTSPRFLPPTKIDSCKIKEAIISHGCFLRECTVEHSIVGERARLDSGVQLKDTLMLGADYYQTDSEIAALMSEGKVPLGIGRDTTIENCIIDKNVRIGKNVIISNKDNVEEADRPEEGFYIRAGIVIVVEKATIKDGTVI
ncbi:glucose-1-phosphate adenylyltransferase large subunit 1-like [Andrographis paniculata]|uniref:glucose-1-phosphate adenylyltransferase large subunit 1-like n=1 Tax=Andrographis paniculata TaxID=175694 RepID=UPI0021E932C8|nr:glucose-1-phosphate adenylyltransferase large subunit 1-like [Andrographis paniculata]XP_051147412.1 glucose-1-phosphate adenylyltransferase large subunit 1-like [Andrographis paniculata]XP_051147413.1 glucose-1-phosphate adenylyltransferase large subunit 1-like [Andrographis paniculata]XP_051147414.1 glucose-1-phosphate adenylyltransferase large subunit 1-like [Andrographis paniculata]